MAQKPLWCQMAKFSRNASSTVPRKAVHREVSHCRQSAMYHQEGAREAAGHRATWHRSQHWRRHTPWRSPPEGTKNQERNPFLLQSLPNALYWQSLMLCHLQRKKMKGPRFSFREQAKGTNLKLRGHKPTMAQVVQSNTFEKCQI